MKLKLSGFRLSDNRLNVYTAFLLQIIAIFSGFIVSKLILVTFGSEVNGLISSINQFLSIISLLEGGLTAVVLSQLYRPIEERDYKKLSRIVVASTSFFRKIAVIFVVYCICLSIIYPLIVKQSFSFEFVCSLILICGLTTFAQYFFSITNRTLLQANQKYYIVNVTMGFSYLANLAFTIISVKIWPQIHLLKMFNSVLFFIQPIVYNHYIKKYFTLDTKDVEKDPNLLKDRWSGFCQNLTYFISLNTDAIILTAFTSLTEVSVYSVYMLVLNAMRQLITSAAGGYQTAIGKIYAQNNYNGLRRAFTRFYFMVGAVSVGLFCVTLLLIVPFVRLYTADITDADYVRSGFAIVMVVAQMFWCIREPYRLIVVSAGKFKETNKGAIIEAIINVIISIVLVANYGLIGVAVGTLISIIYRYLYLVNYVNNNLVRIGFKNLLLFNFIFLIEILVVVLITVFVDFSFIDSAISFILAGGLLALLVFVIQISVLKLFSHYAVNSD